MTLDEVIKAVHHCGLLTGFDDTYEYDGGCPYEDCSKCEQKRMLGKDVIKYLHEYRKQMTDPDGDHQQLEKCRALLSDFYRNDPLKWDELRQMEGKPVWVEYLRDGATYDAEWCIVKDIDDDLLQDTEGYGYGRANKNGDGYGVGWQAYRKERE